MTDYAAGDEPTAQGLNDKLPRFVVKASDESLSTSTTIQSDDELLMTVAASTKYLVELHLVFNSPAAADFKCQWSIPTGASGWWTIASQNLAAASETVYQGSLAFSGGGAQVEGSASDKAVLLRGTLVIAGTAGSVTFQWAQNSSSGTTTVKANSVLMLQKVA